MLHAKLERVLARFLTKIGENGDVAADQGLQSCANCPENRARSYNDAAHHSEILHDPVTIQFKRRGCHRWVHSENLGTVQLGCAGFPNFTERKSSCLSARLSGGRAKTSLANGKRR